MKQLRCTACLFFLFLVPWIRLSAARAQPVSVELYVDRDQVAVGDTLRLNIVVQGGSAMTTPELPPLAEFEIIGRSSESGMIITNGQMSVRHTFIYLLNPQRAGRYDLGPVKVHIEGKEYAAGPIRVTVTNASSPYRSSPPLPPAQSPLSPQLPSGSPRPQTAGTQPVFVTAEIDRREAYLGQQVLYTFRLYSAVGLTGASLHLPDFKDFISEELSKDRKYEVEIGGRRYGVNEWRFALFPTKTGPLAIGPSEVVAQAPAVFPSPGWPALIDPASPRRFATESLELQIKPLPEPVPQDFSALVGSFQLKASLSQTRLKVGESAEWLVEISGTGNIQEAKLPEIAIPSVKIYPSKPQLDISKKLQEVSGKKTFRYALVAERAGAFTVGGNTLHFFDPASDSYRDLQLPTFTLVVEAPAATALAAHPPAVTSPSHEKTETTGDLTKNIAAFKQRLIRPWLYQLGGAICAGFATLWALIFWSKRRSRSKNRRGEMKDKKRSFQKAQKALRALTPNDLHTSIIVAGDVLRTYLGDCFHVHTKAMTPPEFESLLLARGADSQLAHAVSDFFESLDRGKYGGGYQTSFDFAVWQQEALQHLQKLDAFVRASVR